MPSDPLVESDGVHDVVATAQDLAEQFLKENAEAITSLPTAKMVRCAEILDDVRQRGSRVFTIGNGGSAATASHLAADLMKAAGARGRPSVKVSCLSDCIPLLTAWANDDSYDVVFAEPLKVEAEAGDVVVAISGSGRSTNIVRALEVAQGIGLQILGILGMGGGTVEPMCDVSIVVDSDDYEVIENAHMAVCHFFPRYLRDHGALRPT